MLSLVEIKTSCVRWVAQLGVLGVFRREFRTHRKELNVLSVMSRTVRAPEDNEYPERRDQTTLPA